MAWRAILTADPAWILERVWFWYWVIIAALSLACWVNVGLVVILWLLGVQF